MILLLHRLMEMRITREASKHSPFLAEGLFFDCGSHLRIKPMNEFAEMGFKLSLWWEVTGFSVGFHRCFFEFMGGENSVR